MPAGTFKKRSISSAIDQFRTIMSSSESTLASKEPFFRQPFYAKDGKTRLPQYVAHRGFNKLYPENTISAFRAAIEVGCHGIETDVQISKDGVVVISHDATLNRCFGIAKKINDCDWDYLSTLLTNREPREKLIRLSDLLEFLSSPDTAHVWVLLDIKRNNEPNTVIKRIAETVRSGPYSSQPWNLRIILGCWSPNYFPVCNEHLPDFQAALIGFDILAARKALRTVPKLCFNTHFMMVKGPLGYRFVDAVHQSPGDRLVFGWTVNKARDIRWTIRQHFDVILTDDPTMVKQVFDSWDDQYSKEHEKDDLKMTIRETLFLTFGNFWFTFFGWVFPLLYPYVQKFMLEKPAVKAQVKGSTSKT